EVAVRLEVCAALLGDGVEPLRAFGLRGDVADLFQVGQRRIDDAGARAVPVRGLFLEQLDDFVAVPRLLGDECERDELQVALGEHPPAPHRLAPAHAVAAPPARPAEETPPAPAPGAAAFVGFVSHSVHWLDSIPLKDIS